jgi:hypothetical protein
MENQQKKEMEEQQGKEAEKKRKELENKKIQESEKKRKEEEKKKMMEKPLNTQEEIRMKLFEGVCPICNKKSEGLDKGMKRKCLNCETEWTYNQETGLFDKILNYEEKILNYEEKIYEGICPHCNIKSKEIEKGEKRECEKCWREYILNINKTPIQWEEKTLNETFISLEMSIDDHFEYDYLSQTFLLNTFLNIPEEDITHYFHKNKNIIIPTFLLLREEI